MTNKESPTRNHLEEIINSGRNKENGGRERNSEVRGHGGGEELGLGHQIGISGMEKWQRGR